MNKWLLLFLIFLFASALRLLYFPDNIYLGFDQARDIFASLSMLEGDLKIVGPPSSFNENLFHGPLIYYIYAPFLYLSSASPEILSLFLRIYNALGVLIVFPIGAVIFNKRVGVIISLLFATSFEQSQYALFLGHPALAVIPILSFYLGLALVIFKKEWKGFLLSAVSLGLAVQFHYVHILLVLGLSALLVIFRNEIKPIVNWRRALLVLLGFLLTVSTFLLSEIKYNFRIVNTILDLLGSYGSEGRRGSWGDWGFGVQMLYRLIRDNFTYEQSLSVLISTVLLISITGLLWNIRFRKKAIFLTIWLLGGVLPYVLTTSPSYYYGAGASVSLLILVALLIDKLWIRLPFVALILLAAFVVSNISTAVNLNKKGPNLDMVIQPQMLLVDEKRVLDYIYQDADSGPLAVKALTVPLSVNTTWSYLFEWYGKGKYGYLPTWIGPIAEGYEGNLPVTNSRSEAPQTLFLIVEPTVGIREGTIQQFFEDEGYFTKIIEEKQLGRFKVQKRKRY